MKWPLLSIGEICVDTAQRDPREQPEEYFRYVDIASIDRETKRIVEPSSVVGKDAPSRARKEIKTDDVLVSTVRPNLNAVAIVPDDLDGEFASTGFCVLRTDQRRADPRYLYYHVRSTDFIAYLSGRVTGANYPAVTDKVVKEAPIPLPPLDEQYRIVRVLDEAEALRQLRVRADERMADFIPALFNQMFGDPATNPKGWPVVVASSLFPQDRPGTKCGPFGSALKKHEYVSVGIPVWGIDNVSPDQFIEDGSLFIASEKFAELENYSVEPGDILISRAGTVGRLCVARPRQSPSIIGTNLIRLVFDQSKMAPEYFTALLTHFPDSVGQLRANADESAYSFMNTTTLKSLRIPCPSFTLQREFVARVAEARALQDQQARSRSRLEAGFQALLHRAFSGEL